MRLLLTGATGAAGLNVYRAALVDPSITSITLLMRREMPSWAVLPPNAAEKTNTIVHDDFTSYPPDVSSRLVQHDACIWALGPTSVGMNEEDYTMATHDYPLAMLAAMREAGLRLSKDRPADAPFRFVFFSSEMADPTERSGRMFADVKGRTEKDLGAFCAKNSGMKVHNLRPAFFHPSTEYPEDKKHQRVGIGRNILDFVLCTVFSFAIPSLYMPIPELTAATLAIAHGRYPDQELFRNTQLRQIAKELSAKSSPVAPPLNLYRCVELLDM
ncbi:hypothetical protein EUX98_g6835 [Antrodiella citrinella]|uniref:NAD(P)-binding domain-containing protein n=1 Tax=Antrodiella citrinella TaxID=2447956 RepID=A0A4S4MNA9_9APHY|nr:hypothetical protein EUX98_g6835 [Antrodiella citrinella]